MKKRNLTYSKHPVTINEGFSCKNCKKINPKAKKTCRNHCYFCLFSMHIDQITPGDRMSKCLGLMEPVLIDYKSKKGYQIKHRCLACGKEILNKLASDDNLENVINVIESQNS